MRSTGVALVVMGSVLGCSMPPAVTPADPGIGKAIEPSGQALQPVVPGGPGPGAVVPGGPGPGAVVPGGPGPGALAATVPAIPPDALQFRARIYSLADLGRQSDPGPLPEELAPPTSLVKRILPPKLSPAQVREWLLEVPARMVRLDDPGAGGGGAIKVSSRKSGGDWKGPSRDGFAGRTWDQGGGNIRGKGERRWNQEGKSWNQEGKHWNQEGKHWNQESKNWNQEGKPWNQEGKHWNQEDKRWNHDGDRWDHDGGGRHGDFKRRGRHRTRWSSFGGLDTDLFFPDWFGWGDFGIAGNYYFFPASIFSALHFFPYTFAGGYYYPAFCPFFYSAAFFTPYCAAPLILSGAVGLVSGCPTCPLSGRPLLYLPGEVPIL